MAIIAMLQFLLWIQLAYVTYAMVGEDMDNWQLTSLSGDYYWYESAQSSTGQHLAAVIGFDDGNIYLSSDFGSSWKLSNAPKGLEYASVAISANGSFMAALVADDVKPINSLFISTDFGDSWENYTDSLYANSGWRFISCSDTCQYMLAVGYTLVPYVSNDYGKSWDKKMSTTQTWFQSAVSSSGQYQAAVSSAGSSSTGGAPYVSSDFGETFVEGTIVVGREADIFTGVCMSPSGQVMFATCSVCRGGIYASADYGVNWVQLATAPNVSFTEIACSASDSLNDTVITASSFLTNQTYVYTSTDSGMTWNQTSSSLGCSSLSSSGTGQLTLCTVNGKGVYSYTPICAQGYTHRGFDEDSGENPCVGCGKGTYDPGEADTCTDCPSGTYSTETTAIGRATCKDCVYPTWTLNNGATDCSIIFLDVSPVVQGCVFGAAFLWLVSLLAVSKNDSKFASFVIFFFPVLDVSTDLAYLMSSKFYNVTLFILCVVVFLNGLPVLLWKLFKLRAAPTALYRVWWLGYSYSAAASDAGDAGGGDYVPFPTMNSKRIALISSMTSHDSAPAIILELLTWSLVASLQLLTIVLLPAFLLLWLAVGVILQLTHTLAVTSVWNGWFLLWTGDHTFDDIGDGFIDTNDLNYSLLFQFFCETLPQITLQITNNTLLGAWQKDPVALLSFIVSVFNAFSVIYKYAYHTCIKADRLSMVDVPLAMGFATAKVVIRPYTKSLRGKDKEGKTGKDTGDVKEPLLAAEAHGDEEYHPVTLPPVPPASTATAAASGPSRHPPHEAVCALTGKVMVDPVICEDGYTYDRVAIETHMREFGTSPVTKLPLSSHNLIANRAVVSIIRRYQESLK
jgi:hypothetical protein